MSMKKKASQATLDFVTSSIFYQRPSDQDLLFFYSHLRKIGGVMLVETYYVHILEERILPHGAAFTIWNVGKQEYKVAAYCDIDENKIGKSFYC
ncbi:unnamed protein product [Nyctereutes procyonoides]|uniref:(raccoon dog) hypothetical protein n=1 Tax=Nyctereutes procyonoides TaxID=34880 RepID=A0A811Z0T2_NYCPR|nr:unnamed protein product [Nyctereutes procyonoides]